MYIKKVKSTLVRQLARTTALFLSFSMIQVSPFSSFPAFAADSVLLNENETGDRVPTTDPSSPVVESKVADTSEPTSNFFDESPLSPAEAVIAPEPGPGPGPQPIQPQPGLHEPGLGERIAPAQNHLFIRLRNDAEMDSATKEKLAALGFKVTDLWSGVFEEPQGYTWNRYLVKKLQGTMTEADHQALMDLPEVGTVSLLKPEVVVGLKDLNDRQALMDELRKKGLEPEIWTDGLIVKGFKGLYQVIRFVRDMEARDGVKYASLNEFGKENLQPPPDPKNFVIAPEPGPGPGPQPIQSTLEFDGDHFKTTIVFDDQGNPVSAKRVYDDGKVEIYGQIFSQGDAMPIGGLPPMPKGAVALSNPDLTVWFGVLEETDYPDGRKTLYAYGDNYTTTIEIDANGNPVSAQRVYDDGTIEIYGHLRTEVEVFQLPGPHEVVLFSQGHSRNTVPMQIIGVLEQVINGKTVEYYKDGRLTKIVMNGDLKIIYQFIYNPDGMLHRIVKTLDGIVPDNMPNRVIFDFFNKVATEFYSWGTKVYQFWFQQGSSTSAVSMAFNAVELGNWTKSNGSWGLLVGFLKEVRVAGFTQYYNDEGCIAKITLSKKDSPDVAETYELNYDENGNLLTMAMHSGKDMPIVTINFDFKTMQAVKSTVAGMEIYKFRMEQGSPTSSVVATLNEVSLGYWDGAEGSWTRLIGVLTNSLPQPGLREPNPESLIGQRTRVRAFVMGDLVNTFGMTETMLQEAVKAGFIKILVDLKNLRAKVTINPDIHTEGRTDLVYLADLLGTYKLPGQIFYDLNHVETACMGPGCPTPGYYLKTASFNVEGKYFELTYGGWNLMPSQSNLLDSVKIYDGDPHLVCITAPCPTGKLVKEIAYGHRVSDAELVKLDGTPIPTIVAKIIYYEGSQGEVFHREVQIARMSDGRNHIQTVVDRDQEGNAIAFNRFNYATWIVYVVCAQGTKCVPPPPQVFLRQITRTDANGQPLSEIMDISGDRANVLLPDNRKIEVMFHTLEELIQEAMKLEQESVQVKNLVTQDIINSFGVLAEAIKEGLIKIEVDLKNLRATVTINPDIKVESRPDLAYLADLLGTYKLPGQIFYDLNHVETACMGPGCVPPGYYLKAAYFNVEGKYFELDYGSFGLNLMPPQSNLLASVKIYNADPRVVCIMAPCPTGKLIKEITYVHLVGNEVNLVGAPIPSIKASIVYHDDSQGEVVSREVVLATMEDGQNHIQTIVDRNAESNAIATSKFDYVMMVISVMCVEGQPCVQPPPRVILRQITRTDANGNLLSHITEISGDQAAILMPNGTQVPVTFQTLEDLLQRAMEEEAKTPETPLIALVQNDLLASFGLNAARLAELIKQGLIRVVVNMQTMTVDVIFEENFNSLRDMGDDSLYLIDPLGPGKHKWPEVIHYQLELGPQMGMPCTIYADGRTICPPPVYQLVSATFRMDNWIQYDLSYLLGEGEIKSRYGDNRLHSVKIWEDNLPLIPGQYLQLIKEIHYDYVPSAKPDAPENIVATIIYARNGDEGKVYKRVVEIDPQAFFGKGDIHKITDYDAMGKMLSVSELTWSFEIGPVLLYYPNTFPKVWVMLESIKRTNADGKLLSSFSGENSELTLADGSVHKIDYIGLEDLLINIINLETFKQIDSDPLYEIVLEDAEVLTTINEPSTLQQGQISLRGQDGKIYLAIFSNDDNAQLQKGMHVKVSLTNPSPAVEDPSLLIYQGQLVPLVINLGDPLIPEVHLEGAEVLTTIEDPSTLQQGQISLRGQDGQTYLAIFSAEDNAQLQRGMRVNVDLTNPRPAVENSSLIIYQGRLLPLVLVLSDPLIETNPAPEPGPKPQLVSTGPLNGLVFRKVNGGMEGSFTRSIYSPAYRQILLWHLYRRHRLHDRD